MGKLLSPAIAFICALGGLSFLFLTPVSLTEIIILLIVFVVLFPLLFFASKKLRPLKITKVALIIISMLSCAFSVTVASKLIINTLLLDKTYYPLIALVTLLLAALIAISKNEAVKSVSLICSLAVSLIFIITILLSLIDTDFSAVAPVKFSIGLPFLICVYGCLDMCLTFKITKNKMPFNYLIGAAAAFLILLVSALSAMSVLSHNVYHTLDMPIIRLWQSTYIASFINRFEIVTLTALYTVTAVKSGLVFTYAIKNITPKYRFLTIFITSAFVIALSFL